jgi:hypothetical protein
VGDDSLAPVCLSDIEKQRGKRRRAKIELNNGTNVMPCSSTWWNFKIAYKKKEYLWAESITDLGVQREPGFNLRQGLDPKSNVVPYQISYLQSHPWDTASTNLFWFLNAATICPTAP